MEIYKSRIVLLEEQLNNEVKSPIMPSEKSLLAKSSVEETKEPENQETEEVVHNEESHEESIQDEPQEIVDDDKHDETTEKPEESFENTIYTSSTSMGPPQPELPPTSEIDSFSIETLLQQKEELEKEIETTQQSIQMLQKELEESKQINL